MTRPGELLERDELLDQLAAFGPGRLVFVGGEAGVGKSALMRAFAARADAPVLEGACENLTTPTPLGPFLDVSERATAAGEPRRVAMALLDELAARRIVVLEDLHWADQATLDVLRVLGRRIDRTPSLVIATYREDEVEGEHPLRLVLGELASAAPVARVSVRPLSVDAVRELAHPHGADADALYRLTRGNAFYVTEVLATPGDTLPPTVRDAVLARAAMLEPRARRLLEAAAVVPARAELWLLEAVSPSEFELLDACLASGVLRTEGDSVAFRHELARLALESSVTPQRRRTLHASILRALASPPIGVPDPARLAHHAEEAGDTAAVLENSLAAALRAAESFAHREAFAQYARALRYGDALSPVERAATLTSFAHQATITGQYEESVAAYRGAIELFRELGDALGEGQNLARLASPYIALGRNAEAEEASLAAIEVLERLPRSSELAVAYASQAYVRMLRRDNDDGVFWGGKAEALAAETGDQDTRAFGLNLIGTSYVMAGEIDRGIDHLLRSIEIAKASGIAYRVGAGYSMLASGLGEMYDLDRSEQYARKFLAHAEDHGIDQSYILSWLACARVYLGDWDEGAALAQSVLARGHGAIGRITALIALGRLRARRGDPGATEVLDEALELAVPGGHLQRLGHVRAARAEAAWLVGDRDRVLTEARAVYELALEKRHLWFAGELAYWQWKAGALDDAPEWIARPYRLQLDGDVAGAAEAWRARSCPYEAARALAEADDEELLLEALAEFERLGAGPAARHVRRTLRDAGAAVPRGPRPATRANPADLTPRELDVLRLVADGLRNTDVADELVLSRRTVDHHVSAILRKLEVKTRGEAAAAASRLGLLQDRPQDR